MQKVSNTRPLTFFHIVFECKDATRFSFEVEGYFCLPKIETWCRHFRMKLPSFMHPCRFTATISKFGGTVVHNYEDFEKVALSSAMGALRFPYLYNLFFIYREKDFNK